MKTAFQQFIYDESRSETKEMAFYLNMEKSQIKEAFDYGELTATLKERLDYDPNDHAFNDSEEYFTNMLNEK